MTRYFLETSAIINYLRGVAGTVAVIDALEGDLVSSYVCLAELYEGVTRIKQPKDAEESVLGFFAGCAEIYGIDASIARAFGTLRYDLKRRGERLEDMDILLAVTCITHHLPMVTANEKHFRRIHDLAIIPLKPSTS